MVNVKCVNGGFEDTNKTEKLLKSFKAKHTGHISEKSKSLTVPLLYEKFKFCSLLQNDLTKMQFIFMNKDFQYQNYS